MKPEGWYQDPYGLHEDRWFSDGSPTNLVRDRGTESHDPPPATAFKGPLIEAETVEGSDGRDLKRVDEDETATGADDLKRADKPGPGESYGETAEEAAAESGLGFE